MKLSSFLLLKAVISLIFGISFLIYPTVAMSIYGVALDEIGILMVRFFGGGLIGIGLICLYQRNTSFETLQSILLALFVADAIGFFVALQAQVTGLMNYAGWSVVAVWLLLALGLFYFRFKKQKPTAI